jgi:hypothetical protein
MREAGQAGFGRGPRSEAAAQQSENRFFLLKNIFRFPYLFQN